jgi:microcystin-dependent protein
MGQPYVGEIRMFAGNFAPNGWMFCEGQTLPIAENEVLFQLIGTTYGGDGEETFNLPNLASRVPIHMGTGPDGTTYQIGEMAGTEQETLTVQQIPNHNHSVLVTNAAGVASPSNALFAVSNSTQSGTFVYNGDDDPGTTLNPATLSPAGGSQPHENTQPFLCINFIISLFGVFPSQT